MKIIGKVLNISEHEIPRTLYAWSLLFLYRLGFIIGTTIFIAIFVSQFGINALPILVLIQALLTIAGMFAFSFINEHFTSKKIIPLCAFAAGLFIFMSTFFTDQKYVFFSILLMITGVLLPQITIFLANYIEDFFTPLECERTFPLIESAQTIGGIIAGVLITTLSPYVASYKFFYLWILFLFLCVSVILFLEPFSSEHHHIFQKQENSKKNFRDKVKKIKENLYEIKLVPFLQGLLVIFLLHWIIGYVFEFQYTKLIDEAVTSTTIATHEASLTHGLGSFHILFNVSALAVQFLAASRIFRKIGTVGSFLLHSFVTFLSSVSLLLGFGYFTVILAKNNFELSGIVHKNAYEASYYALRHGSQRQVREFFEAFINPIGTILGSLVVLFVQFFFLSQHTFLALQIILVFLTVGMIFFSLRLQRSYTKLSKENLLQSHHRVAKFHAIEILSQKGHRDHLSAFIQTLKNPREIPEVKVKILNIFYDLADPLTIPLLMDFLHNDNEDLVYAAVRALSGFKNFGQKIFHQAFSRYRVIEELKKLFEHTASERVREGIIQTFVALHYEDVVPFLLKAMESGSEAFQIACIKVCSLFQDPALADYLAPFLKSHSPFIRAQTVAALWSFPQYRSKLRSILNMLFHSAKREDFLAYCSVIGDIGNKNDQQKLLFSFDVYDPVLKLTVAYALFKLGNKDAVDALVHLLFSKNLLVLQKAKGLFCSLKPEQKKNLQNIVQREVSHRLQPFFSLHIGKADPAQLRVILEKCREVYYLLDLHDEALHINDIFDQTFSPLHAF